MTDEEWEAAIRTDKVQDSANWKGDTQFLLRLLDAARATLAERDRVADLERAQKDAEHWHQLFGQASGEFDQAETAREAAEARVAALEAALRDVDARAGDMSHTSTSRCGDIGRIVRAALAAPAAPRDQDRLFATSESTPATSSVSAHQTTTEPR